MNCYAAVQFFFFHVLFVVVLQCIYGEWEQTAICPTIANELYMRGVCVCVCILIVIMVVCGDAAEAQSYEINTR